MEKEKESFSVYKAVRLPQIAYILLFCYLVFVTVYLYGFLNNQITENEKISQKLILLENEFLKERQHNSEKNKFMLEFVKKQIEAVKPLRKGVVKVKKGKRWVKQCVLY